MIEHSDAHLVVGRGDLRIIANLGPTPFTVPAHLVGEVVFESTPSAVSTHGDRAVLAHEATIVTRVDPS